MHTIAKLCLTNRTREDRIYQAENMKFIDCTDLIEPIEFTIKLYDEHDECDEQDTQVPRVSQVELMYQTNPTSLLVTINDKTLVYTNEQERSIWSTMLMQWHDVLIVPRNCEDYSSYGTPPSSLRGAYSPRVMKDLDMLRTLYPSRCYIIARLNDIIVDDGMYVSTIKTGLTWLAWCVKYMLRYNQEIAPLLNAMPMIELIKLVYRCVQGDTELMDNVSVAIRNCLTSNARSIYRILLGDQFYDERKKYVIYGWIMKDRYILERPNTELFDPSQLDRRFIGPLDLPIKFVTRENQDIPARLISIIQHGLILSDLLDKENKENEENNSTSLIIHHIMWNLMDKVNIKDLERRMNSTDKSANN